RLHRLADDGGPLNGRRQRTLALPPPALDGEDVAADRRPCETDRHTRDARTLLDLFELEPRHAQEGRDEVGTDPYGVGAPLGTPPRHFPAHARDLPLEIADAGLTRVAAGQEAQRFRRELDVDGRIEAVLPRLLGHE